MVKALRFTKNAVDLIPYVTVELWYIPRADTHSNRLKQRDRIIHPTNQYEFPGPEKKYKSTAAPWSVSTSTPPPSPRKGEKKNTCQQENVSGFYTDGHSHWAANSPWQLCLDQRGRGEFVRLGFLLLCAWSQFRVLQKMLLFVRNCGKKEICCQVCPSPSNAMHIHIREVSGVAGSWF